jgi:hypothetical protein
MNIIVWPNHSHLGEHISHFSGCARTTTDYPKGGKRELTPCELSTTTPILTHLTYLTNLTHRSGESTKKTRFFSEFSVLKPVVFAEKRAVSKKRLYGQKRLFYGRSDTSESHL